MLLSLLLQAQAMGPESCSLTGICLPIASGPRIPSGIMFTAVGLVGLGVWHWRRAREADNVSGER